VDSQLPAEPCECQWTLPQALLDRAMEDYCLPYVACVPLSQIIIKPVWDPERLSDIRKWANEETLNSAKVEVEVGGRFAGVDSWKLPRLGRDDGGKYVIGDGIHRVNRAKELGLSCILSLVYNCHTLETSTETTTEQPKSKE